MNVIELLKKDHESVARLFAEFDAAKEAERDADKESAVSSICRELSLHAAVEEEIFYPAVETRAVGEDEKSEDSVKEAYEEHALVKTLVAELSEMKADDEQFDAKVKVLKDLVEHHVEEEEGELMPRARKLLSEDELEAMGAAVESRKDEPRAEAPRAVTSKARAENASSSKSKSKGKGASRRPAASHHRAPSARRRSRKAS
jgi:hemerythrin superfamily protein